MFPLYWSFVQYKPRIPMNMYIFSASNIILPVPLFSYSRVGAPIPLKRIWKIMEENKGYISGGFFKLFIIKEDYIL